MSKLSWHKARRQWKKQRDGKVYYLGRSGVNKTDAAALREAQTEWDGILRDLEAGEQAAASDTAWHSNDAIMLRRRLRSIASHAEKAGSRDSVHLRDLMADAQRLGVGEQFAAEVRQHFPADRQPTPCTVSDAIVKFMDAFGKQCATGARSLNRRDALRVHLNHLASTVVDGRQLDAVPIASFKEAELRGYYNQLVDAVSTGAMASETAKGRLSACKQFLRWCAGEGMSDLPRSINSRDITIAPQLVEVEAAERDDVKKLLSSAGLDRTRLYILLALNCGMTQVDIMKLAPDEVDWDAGRVKRKRSKTQKHKAVPVVDYKLWPETFRLLCKEGQRTGDRVLLNQKGKPLIKQGTKKDGKLSRTDNVSLAFKRLVEKIRKTDPTFKLTFKNLRSGSATLLGSHATYRGLAVTFLGHVPQSIAERHYVAVPQNLLDEAIDWLGEQLLPTEEETQ